MKPVISGVNLGVLEIAKERADELKQLHDAIVAPNRKRTALQLLPRHMRRRAASHNPKRLPCRIRQLFQRQVEASQESGDGRAAVSRRSRRRRHQLATLARRQSGSHVWLETHVWHAKRFHMTSAWGYRLPLRSSAKTFRTCYRASCRGCLVQDVSYLCHVELCGGESALLSGLARLGYSSHSTSRGGSYQVRVWHCADLPDNTLAPVGVLWNGQHVTAGSEVRQLWLWTHPAALSQLIDQLTVVFHLLPSHTHLTRRTIGDITQLAGPVCQPSCGGGDNCDDDGAQCDAAETGGKNVDQLKLRARAPHLVTCYCSRDGDVCVSVLKDRLGRLRLTGAASQHVLQACLRPVEDSDGAVSWSQSTPLTEQAHTWRRMSHVQSPAELPARCVLALTVQDPRLHLPLTRTLTSTTTPVECEDSEVIESLHEDVADSVLWRSDVRHAVTSDKVSDNTLNRNISQQLLTTDLSLASNTLAPVPLLLLQRPSPPGWDLILPLGWAMTFWVCLQYRGARAGALQESNRLALEYGLMRYPEDFPDTSPGEQYERQQLDKLKLDYFSRPPSKRCNLIKMRVPAPFSSVWRHVLSLPVDQSVRVWRAGGCGDVGGVLVAVRVVACGGGVPRATAMLCAPACDDVFDAAAPNTAPCETAASDTHRSLRRHERATWHQRLAAERRKRRQIRRKCGGDGGDILRQAGETMSQLRQERLEQCQHQVLPPADTSVSRQLVGRVCFGDFCMSLACGAGIGLVSSQACASCPPPLLLLFRNYNSLHYHWCRVEILSEPAL